MTGRSVGSTGGEIFGLPCQDLDGRYPESDMAAVGGNWKYGCCWGRETGQPYCAIVL